METITPWQVAWPAYAPRYTPDRFGGPIQDRRFDLVEVGPDSNELTTFVAHNPGVNAIKGTHRILTHGDSVAWGCNDDEQADRLPPKDRFSVQVLGDLALLDGQGYTSFEHAVNGMTTDQDRADRPGRNSLAVFPEVLKRVKPHSVVVHLGLNDLNKEIHRTAAEAAEGVGRNLNAIIAHNAGQRLARNRVRNVVVLGPSPIVPTRRFNDLQLPDYFSEQSMAESFSLGPEIRKMAHAYDSQNPDIAFSFAQVNFHGHRRWEGLHDYADGLHLGALGHAAIARSVAHALLRLPGSELMNTMNGFEAYDPELLNHMLPHVNRLQYQAIVSSGGLPPEGQPAEQPPWIRPFVVGVDQHVQNYSGNPFYSGNLFVHAKPSWEERHPQPITPEGLRDSWVPPGQIGATRQARPRLPLPPAPKVSGLLK
ncbi:MAG TPA: SGNH/GDSL hydrolase family protein [Candidatus Saccharimonadales bacterium]|nr:SGNH/GDSL hydrolase family protein [Candidatus Saccharimonadales bacterium]